MSLKDMRDLGLIEQAYANTLPDERERMAEELARKREVKATGVKYTHVAQASDTKKTLDNVDKEVCPRLNIS